VRAALAMVVFYSAVEHCSTASLRFRVVEEVLKGDQQPIPIVKLLFALPSPLFLIPLSIANLIRDRPT
jgi:hypothetical protein